MKNICAVMLALTLLAAIPFTAFADDGQTICYVDEFGEEVIYRYGGRLSTGENQISGSDSIRSYYIFTPDRNGVYAFQPTYASLLLVDGEAVDLVTPVNSLESDALVSLHCLGGNQENYIVIPANNGDPVTITFLGDLVDFTVPDDEIFMINHNVHPADDEGYLIYDDFNLRFSETENNFTVSEIRTMSPVKPGENEIEVKLLGKSFLLSLTVRKMEEFVSGVSLPEDFRLRSTEIYNGEIRWTTMPAFVNVTYTNGKSEKVRLNKYDEIIVTLPNSKPCYGFFLYGLDCHLKLSLADQEYDFGKNIEKATVLQNTVCLLDRLGSLGSDAMKAAFLIPFVRFDPELKQSLQDEIKALPSAITNEIRLYFAATKG